MTDKIDRPYATVILAISADGKIADAVRSPARFGSAKDKAHLEQQVAASDAVLFGNGTLQAYGTTMRVISPELVKQRELQGKPPQPVQIVCSRSAQFDPNLRFFQQPVPRWLLTGQDSRETALPSPYPTKDSKFDRTSGTILKNGQDARSTKDKFSCGTGILPVHKRLIDKGAISKLKQTLLLFCGHSNPRIRYLQINPIAATCWESESRPTAPFHLR